MTKQRLQEEMGSLQRYSNHVRRLVGVHVYVCGSTEHRAFECPDRADTDDREKKKSSAKRVTLETGESSKKQKTNIDWNRHTRREERNTADENSDEALILMSNSCNEGSYRTAFDAHRRRTFGTERKSSTEVANDSERRHRRSKYVSSIF